MSNNDMRRGDVVDTPTGITRTVERFIIHDVFVYADGSASARARYASNPRGVDWRLFIEADSATLVSRGVAAVDAAPRSLLPST